MNVSDHDENPDTNEKGKTYLRDMAKPVGDACRADGTLKDANEMVWVTSPTADEGPSNNFHESHDFCDDMYVPPDYPDKFDDSDENLQNIQVSFVNACKLILYSPIMCYSANRFHCQCA
jgi:hypothetical protein